MLLVSDLLDVVGTEANVNSRDAETFALILKERRALTEELVRELAMEYIQAAKRNWATSKTVGRKIPR